MCIREGDGRGRGTGTGVREGGGGKVDKGEREGAMRQGGKGKGEKGKRSGGAKTKKNFPSGREMTGTTRCCHNLTLLLPIMPFKLTR